MGILRSFGLVGSSDVMEYDPHRLSSPQVFVLSMLVFLAIVAFIAAILTRQISSAFASNPGLNGLILGVFVVGVFLAFQQTVRLFREVRWINSFRAGSEVNEPVLLAPMKALLSRSSSMALSTASMRTMLDSIATRLDESRDITRYLTGLLVFLGLLGTFWGLLHTIGSIGETIQALDPGSGDVNDVLEALKAGLAAPLSGMGTAFSSSLFGLAGSLVVGFLAAGLIWGLYLGSAGVAVTTFFLLCVLIAGLFGAATASRRILFVQALPAALALAALWLGW